MADIEKCGIRKIFGNRMVGYCSKTECCRIYSKDLYESIYGMVTVDNYYCDITSGEGKPYYAFTELEKLFQECKE